MRLVRLRRDPVYEMHQITRESKQSDCRGPQSERCSSCRVGKVRQLSLRSTRQRLKCDRRKGATEKEIAELKSLFANMGPTDASVLQKSCMSVAQAGVRVGLFIGFEGGASPDVAESFSQHNATDLGACWWRGASEYYTICWKRKQPIRVTHMRIHRENNSPG